MDYDNAFAPVSHSQSYDELWKVDSKHWQNQKMFDEEFKAVVKWVGKHKPDWLEKNDKGEKSKDSVDKLKDTFINKMTDMTGLNIESMNEFQNKLSSQFKIKKDLADRLKKAKLYYELLNKVDKNYKKLQKGKERITIFRA